MTPKEFNFFADLIEKTAKASYALGFEDHREKKAFDDARFRMTAGNKLILKKELNSFTKKR